MSGRAMEPLTKAHLSHLGALAARDRERLFARCPHLAIYRERLLCVALCQGGALHYVDGCNGVKDLDVWSFYASGPGPQYPPRRKAHATYPASGLTGWSERVDLLGRYIDLVADPDPVAHLLHNLRTQPTYSARCLAEKAVVLIEPHARLGEVIWPEPL